MGRTQAQLAVETNLSAATISRRMKQGWKNYDSGFG